MRSVFLQYLLCPQGVSTEPETEEEQQLTKLAEIKRHLQLILNAYEDIFIAHNLWSEKAQTLDKIKS